MLYGNISRIILFVINRFSHKLNCFTLQEIISSWVKNVGDKVVSRQLAKVTPWKGFGARLSEGFLLLIKPGEESQLSAWECFSWWQKKLPNMGNFFTGVFATRLATSHTSEIVLASVPSYKVLYFLCSKKEKKLWQSFKKKTRGTLV